MSEFKECPHGYDIACLICGFGTENEKRVVRRKSAVQPNNNVVPVYANPKFTYTILSGAQVGSVLQLTPQVEDIGDDFPIENHISPNCQSRGV